MGNIERPEDRYLILSLDGGGTSGALQVRILERLEDRFPFLDKVKLIAGASIGGVNALSLAAGGTPSELVEMYIDETESIFQSRDWLDWIAGPADEAFRANYINDGLRDAVEACLGKKRLSELSKKVLIAAFDLDNQDSWSTRSAGTVPERRFWKPKFFHNYDLPGNDGFELAIDIALRTSAAPTYFPSYQGFIDGGIVANNPAMCAVGQAVEAGISLDRIVVLSVGTGISPTHIEGDRLDWGYKQWIPKMLPLMLDGMVGVPDYVCSRLLPGRYVRVNPYLPEDLAIDAADRVDDLLEWANDADIGSAVELLSSMA